MYEKSHRTGTRTVSPQGDEVDAAATCRSFDGYLAVRLQVTARLLSASGLVTTHQGAPTGEWRRFA